MRLQRPLTVSATFALAQTAFYATWLATCGAQISEYFNPGMWLHIAATSLLCGVPALLWRRMLPAVVIAVACWLLMLANTMYLRNFGSWIPIGSYSAVGNLADFTDAVVYSLSLADAIIPLIFIAGLTLARKAKWRRPDLKSVGIYGTALALAICVSVFVLNGQNGLGHNLDELKANHRDHALAASRYSLAVVTIADAINAPKLTAENSRHIQRAMARRIAAAPTAKKNLVVIFMESLEGWVIGENIGGTEITPALNALAADSTTLFIPNLRPDTGPGRSIDAQLLLLTGLMPPTDRIWSFAYPGNNYPSLYKAMKQHDASTKIAAYTTDHEGIYNIGQLSPRLGIDSLHCHAGAVVTTRHGRPARRHRMPDGEFFDFVSAALDSTVFWGGENPKALQITTYSCHSPFRMPERGGMEVLDGLPDDLARYLRVVHYTDSALGKFVSWIKTQPEYNNTLVVIMGDHPAFGSDRRRPIARHFPRARRAAVPLLILNAGESADCLADCRQIDVYPTLLRLMGLTDYSWHGLGRPLTGPQSPRIAAPDTLTTLSSLIFSRNLLNP